MVSSTFKSTNSLELNLGTILGWVGPGWVGFGRSKSLYSAQLEPKLGNSYKMSYNILIYALLTMLDP